jgi:hypothetical protein
MTNPTNDVPVACTLGAAELATQAARWKALFAGAATERVVTGDGLRVAFRRDPAVERELRELVAVEIECCKWADWRIDARPRELVLDISATGDGIPVIQSWFLGV